MVVCDTAPLLYLARVRRLGLLRELYGGALIPGGVWQELGAGRGADPAAAELRAAIKRGWLRVRRARRLRGAQELEPTDLEVLYLALQRREPLVTNDRALALTAQAYGIDVIWFTQVPQEAVRRGRLKPREARALLTRLVRAGLRVRTEVLTYVLESMEKGVGP